MTPFILDTSALLAYLWKEPGEARVAQLLATERCLLGATNLAELVSKVVERGFPLGDRACLALTKTWGGVAVTADRPWQALDLGIAIECIRPDSH